MSRPRARAIEDRRTRMVFITRDLPQEAIEAALIAFEKAVEEPAERSRSPPANRRRAGAVESFSLPQLRPQRRRRLLFRPAPSWDRMTSSIW
jgi:hypothetical protein